MNIYWEKPIKMLKLFIVSAASILIIGLVARVFAYLLKFEVNPVFRRYTDGILMAFPGYIDDVDFTSAGFDIHGIFGIVFIGLLAFLASRLATKLFRKSLPLVVSGIVDSWTYLMLLVLSFGWLIDAIELNPGSSPITDLAHQTLIIANEGSFTNQIHLTALFLMFAVALIGILCDTLLKIRFPELHNITTAQEVPQIKLQDFEGILNIEIPQFPQTIPQIKLFENKKAIKPWGSWFEFVEP